MSGPVAPWLTSFVGGSAAVSVLVLVALAIGAGTGIGTDPTGRKALGWGLLGLGACLGIGLVAGALMLATA